MSRSRRSEARLPRPKPEARSPRSGPLLQSAREVADDQPFARPLEAPEQLAQSEARPACAVAARHREVLIGIDGQAARLHLIDALACHQLAELLGLALLIGHAREAQEVDGGVHAATRRQPA